ncbi:hypothetical protein [Sphingopyxis granuli]|uniref:hypothetical protein n=1 Tax=Sphingopyxis granuli TaxID=267128 RepID=UPI001BAFEA55|nr:hypothetical protein [Sphingopyxis granuli]QUM72199.1 hypothetical protein ICN83_18210 [Sphingopyxis granuli]
MAEEVETRTYDQLPRATAISPEALLAFQEEASPLSAIKLKKLLGRLIQTDTVFEEEAAPDGIQGDVDHDEFSVGLVFADPDPAKNGWYRKVGASGAGNWSQFEKLQSFAASEAGGYVAEAQAARDEAIAQNAGGALGDLKVKTSDVDGAVDWLARPALGEQPVVEAVFTLDDGNPMGGQFARSAASTATFAADGDMLKITSPGTSFTWAGILLPVTAAPGRVFEVSYAVGAFDTNGGVGIGFTATAPVVGSPDILNLPADFGGLQWRPVNGNGLRVPYGNTGVAAPAAPATLVIAGSSNGGLSGADFGCDPGDTVGFRVEFNDTGTGARVYHLVNGRVLRGTLDGYTDLTGIQAGAYIWVGIHGGTAAPDDVASVGPATMYSSAIDIPRSLYADASAVIAGTGTQDDPLLAPDEVARFIALDRHRRQFRIRLKSGVYHKPLVIPDSRPIDELVIEAPQGEKCIIEPADRIEGDGLWEAIAGQPNLWRRPAVFGGDTSYALGNASIIEVPGTAFPNLVQMVGSGAWTHSYPWVIYTRRPNEYSLAALNDEPASYCVHMTGPHAGYLIVHARGSADPNDLAFKRPLENNAVAVLCADPDAWNLTRVILDGIEGRFTYADIFRFQRCRVEHGPLIARASSTGPGFQYDECVTRGYAPTAEGTAGDGYNMSGSFGDLPVDLQPWTGLWSAKALGSPLLATSFGDGFSNHEHQKASLYDFLAVGMGKDGLSAGGDFTVNGASFLGCSDSGVKLYGVAGTANRGTLRNVHVAGCQYGIANLQDKAAGSGTIDAYDMLFEAIGLYAAYANKPGGDSAIINLRGRQDYIGAAPGTGYYGGDGAITRQTLAAMPQP